MNLINQLIIETIPTIYTDNIIRGITSEQVSTIREIMDSYLIDDYSEESLSNIKREIREAYWIHQLMITNNINMNDAVVQRYATSTN